MKFIYVSILILILGVGYVGCASPETATDTPTEVAVSEPSGESATDIKTQGEVIIKAYYEKPESLNNIDTITLDGLLEGEEYIEVIVDGEIFDFQQIELMWNESDNVLEEKQIVKTIEKLSNQTLVIKTYQPEIIPAEKIKWKSSTGKTYEYIIQDRNLGDTDNSITKFEISKR